jgi:hypothetical protein
MSDDVLINKAATIERCLVRAHKGYATKPAGFAIDFTRQDAGIVNVQGADVVGAIDAFERADSPKRQHIQRKLAHQGCMLAVHRPGLD